MAAFISAGSVYVGLWPLSRLGEARVKEHKTRNLAGPRESYDEAGCTRFWEQISKPRKRRVALLCYIGAQRRYARDSHGRLRLGQALASAKNSLRVTGNKTKILRYAWILQCSLDCFLEPWLFMATSFSSDHREGTRCPKDRRL